jgi:hypothetical protein
MAMTETRKRLNRRYMWVVREGIAKCLRKHGFSRKNLRFWRDCDPTVAFAIYAGRDSPWNPDTCSFGLDCGMVVRIVPTTFEQPPADWVPCAESAQIRVQPEVLARRSLGLEINAEDSDDDVAALAMTCTRLLEDVVLPWFSKFKTARDVGDYLTSEGERPGKIWFGWREIKHHPESLRNAAIAYFAAGDHDRALELLDLAAKTNDVPGLHLTLELRTRLARLIASRKSAH